MFICTAIVTGVMLAAGAAMTADPAPTALVPAPPQGALAQLSWIDDPLALPPGAMAFQRPAPRDVVIVWPPADGSVPGSQTYILPDLRGHQHAESWSSGEEWSGRGDGGAGGGNEGSWP
ncbi:hypothetical protein Pth03_52810 [Planotetraspora thailandica]|uniref:Uncharacterized protein n=2 Tax=Planotetraspora thailandica TaxID=487172 RepID=A0A8J3V7I4_9ACTN|nr:hypothetical protein Pth03_52810 [Planotetraspora thailandica]